MNRGVRIIRAGRIPYATGLKLQSYIASSVTSNQETGALILCEHNPVYTVGLRNKTYKNAEQLRNLGADYFETNRGGLITFHGPGQLMAYPIINLKNYKPSVRWYIHNLEDCVIDLCRNFSLRGMTSEHTGVWIGDSKICAMGIHVKRYVTTHGLALNCNVDLGWFEHIVPCGIEDKGVTSLSKELGRTVTVDETIPYFLDCFKLYFNCEFFEENNVSQILKNIQ